jgi:hypothetical protein
MTVINPDPTALVAAATVAAALADPRAVQLAANRGRERPQSLAGGAIGIALLHIERARTGHGDADTAHKWLSSAAGEAVSAGSNANLFNGAPAIGFVLACATAGTGKYHRALAAIDDQVTTVTRRRIDAGNRRIDQGAPLVMREFDLIHGLAGLAAYHLLRHPDSRITREVLAYLARLTRPLAAEPLPAPVGALPPWWMPAGLTGQPSRDFPYGHGNLGVAHGISAVIAALSLAVLHDSSTTDTDDAIATLCAWTDQWQQNSDTEVWWPGYLTIGAECGVVAHRSRPSWCYGVAGIARAQQLAGLALGDEPRRRVAETAMLAVLRDSAQLASLPEIGLCHGKAGLLQSAWRMAADAGNSDIAVELPRLSGQLVEQLQEPFDNPELLDGAAGAALALHTVGVGSTEELVQWDRFLALS